MKRRQFVSTLAGGALLAGCASAARGSRPSAAIGIQLYTVRRAMAEAPAATLAALAGMGYREVELHSLYRLTAPQFKKLLEDNGLVAPATHVSLAELERNTQKVFDDAATLGHKWLIVPWIDRADRTPDGYRKIADSMNRLGPQAKAAGFRLGYHNHEFEWLTSGGEPGFDILLERTSRDFVDFELDLFWIRRTGADPVHYFRKYPGRFVAVHVKDMAADGRMVDVGAGTIDFAQLFTEGRKAGVKHFFVEHDEPADALSSARNSFAAMKKLLS